MSDYLVFFISLIILVFFNIPTFYILLTQKSKHKKFLKQQESLEKRLQLAKQTINNNNYTINDVDNRLRSKKFSQLVQKIRYAPPGTELEKLVIELNTATKVFMTGHDINKNLTSEKSKQEMLLIIQTINKELDSYCRIVDTSVIENLRINKLTALDYLTSIKRGGE